MGKSKENSKENTKEDLVESSSTKVENRSSESNSLNFGSVITFLGIVGVIIGCISLYFYAVANNWISPIARVAIGVIIAFLMFIAGYMLNEKNRIWSFLVIGGSIAIGFLSVGIGVLNYGVLTPSVGFAILTLFVAIAGMLSVKFSSRIIAYYTIAGGFLVPIVSKVSSNLEFTMLYILLLSAALLYISSKFNWSDLRLVSFLLVFMTFFAPQENNLLKMQNTLIVILFITLIFLIYNISSLIFAFSNKEEINVLDIVTLNLNSLFNIIYLSAFLAIQFKTLDNLDFGLILLGYSIFYLVEYLFFKNYFDINKISGSISVSLISSMLLTVNIGCYLIFTELKVSFLFLLFAMEWFVFAYMSALKQNEENSVLLEVVSGAFLFLCAIWYFFIIRFDSGVIDATIMMLIFILIPAGSLYLRREVIQSKVVGLLFLISTYCFFYSLAKYLVFFIPSQDFFNVSLSVFWLAFTLFALVALSDNKDAKSLLTILLIAVLVKIAFVDLFMLDGVYRIVGFIVLGVLMLIGGYYLNSQNLISNSSSK